MFTRIKIYNTTDTSVEYDNLNDDFGIGSGSLYLNRRIATQDLEFGQFNSALFQCTVFGFEDDIQGRHIVVSQIDDNNVETNLFNGIIDSAKRDRLGEDRTISAYDWMYYHRDDNMATFWNNYWSNISNSTIVNFRNALLTYLGVPNNPATLPNDNVVIKNAFIDQPVTKLPLNGLMKTLCTVSGAFVYIDENGYLTFKTLSSTTVANLTGKVEGQNSEWEDYITKQITGIGIYDTSNNLAQLVGTTDNVYNIVGNYFFLSMDATQLTSVCNTLLTSLQGVQYVPAKLALKLPEDLSLGDYVQTDNGNTYVFSIELSGVTFINQKVESSASGDTLPQTVEFEEDTLIQGAKISRLQKDIDGLESEFSDLETEVHEDYYTKSQTDSVIAQSAVEIKTEVTEEVTEAVLEQVGGQADNLIPYPYAFDSQVLNGLTFTVSDVDGSITVDGTATDDTDFIIIDIARTDYNTVTLSKLDYVISGCPEDGSLNTYYLAVSQSDGTSVVDIARDYGHEIVGGLSNKFTVTDDESPIGCYIHVASGTTVEDIVFKPQLEYGQAKHEYQYTTTSKTSKIDQHSDEIVLKVDVNGKIVEANLSANASTGTEFKVSADNIDFIANDMINLTANNLGINSTNFTLDAQGNVNATGTITATSFMFWDTLQAYSSYGQYTYDLAKINWQGSDEVWMSIKSPYGQGGTESIRLMGPSQSASYGGYLGVLMGGWLIDSASGTKSSRLELGTSGSIYWKESGYGDQFQFKPQFSGFEDGNYLALSTATGGAGTQPALTEKFKFYPSGILEASAFKGKALALYEHGSNEETPSTDVPLTWGAKGVCKVFYSVTGRLNSQPNQYGHLINFGTGGSEIAQLWFTAPGGNVYRRGANASGWNKDIYGGIWTLMLDRATGLNQGISASAGSNITLTVGTAKQACSLLLSAGKWLISYTGAFPSGNTVTRTCGCVVSTANGGTGPIDYNGLVNYAYNNNNENRVNGAFLYAFSSNTTIYLNLWVRGNSGTHSGCAGRLQAIRLSN